MKQKTVFLINTFLLFSILILTGYALAAEPNAETNATPKAVIEQTTFTFSPVIAGTEVTHCYNIHNKGEAPLNIPGVYTG